MPGLRLSPLAMYGSTVFLILLGSLGLVGILKAPPRPPASKVDPATLSGGKELFDYWCAACHAPGRDSPDSRRGPSTETAQPRRRAKARLLTDRADLSASYVGYIVRHGVSLMPVFPKSEISDAQLSALTAYLSRSTPATDAPGTPESSKPGP